MTASFGARATERLATLRRHQPTGPLMCMELWNGWFDHWGGHHHTTPVAEAAAELDALLAAGASVNLYMFHGGTNFGFTNGANDKGVYQPIVTSYDYDAPLDEAGNPTAKYHAFREVIARHAPVPDPPPPARPAPEFAVPLGDPVRLLDAPERWGNWERHDEPPTFESPVSATLYLPDATVWLTGSASGSRWVEDDRDVHGLGAVPVVPLDLTALYASYTKRLSMLNGLLVAGIEFILSPVVSVMQPPDPTPSL